MEYVILAWLIIVIFTIFILYRNNKVYRFKTFIGSIVHKQLSDYLGRFEDDETFKEYSDEFYLLKRRLYAIESKYSYNKMLFSFKPLKLKSWYTKEEIGLLMGIV